MQSINAHRFGEFKKTESPQPVKFHKDITVYISELVEGCPDSFIERKFSFNIKTPVSRTIYVKLLLN